MGRNNSLTGDPRKTTHPVVSHQSGQEEKCSKYGFAGSPAIQASHPPRGLYVLRLEVRCPHPRPEAAGATIQVSSPRYRCPLIPK
jgi:hypothetical protein